MSMKEYFRRQTTIEGLFIIAGCVGFFKLLETFSFSSGDTKHFAVSLVFVLLCCGTTDFCYDNSDDLCSVGC